MENKLSDAHKETGLYGEPKETALNVYDGFLNVPEIEGRHPRIVGDGDGDTLMDGAMVDFIPVNVAVRVLVAAENRADAARLLRKIAGWIESDPFTGEPPADK